LEFLAIVGFDIVQLSSLKQTAKKFAEFFLFLRAAATLLRTERTLGHLREIKPLIDYFSEFVPSLILFALGLQLRILEDRQELVGGLTNLVPRHSCGHPNRLH
jgi:hypothetical protein